MNFLQANFLPLSREYQSFQEQFFNFSVKGKASKKSADQKWCLPAKGISCISPSNSGWRERISPSISKVTRAVFPWYLSRAPGNKLNSPSTFALSAEMKKAKDRGNSWKTLSSRTSSCKFSFSAITSGVTFNPGVTFNSLTTTSSTTTSLTSGPNNPFIKAKILVKIFSLLVSFSKSLTCAFE